MYRLLLFQGLHFGDLDGVAKALQTLDMMALELLLAPAVVVVLAKVVVLSQSDRQAVHDFIAELIKSGITGADLAQQVYAYVAAVLLVEDSLAGDGQVISYRLAAA